jgi:hypothetical protein
LIDELSLTDPFAPDGRFRYRVVETGREPRPLLYSVGNDGVDDGGAAHPEPNRRTVLERDEGFDWVILDPGRLGDDDGE